jgi:hypothetical protein
LKRRILIQDLFDVFYDFNKGIQENTCVDKETEEAFERCFFDMFSMRGRPIDYKCMNNLLKSKVNNYWDMFKNLSPPAPFLCHA